MNRHTLVFVAASILVASTTGRAQEKLTPMASTNLAQESKPLVPLKMQVTLSRTQGEKKVSSLPYTLTLNANDRFSTSLRMGAQVPIVTTRTESNMPAQVQYRDVGTNIDCTATTLDDGRYRVSLTIEDSSIYGDEQIQGDPKRAGDRPAFRSFRSVNALVLKDGQTQQYTMATDKVTSEVVKVDVTLTVIK